MTPQARALAYDAAVAVPAPTPAAPEPPDDSAYGWKMFVAFCAAVVGISIVVAVLAIIGSWVMLGVAMLAHIVVTGMLMKLILGAFGAEEDAYPDMHRAEQASRAALARGATPPPVIQPRVAIEV